MSLIPVSYSGAIIPLVNPIMHIAYSPYSSKNF